MKKHLLSSAFLLILAGLFSSCNMNEIENEWIVNKEAGVKSFENTTTQYFYYYNGEKQYLELDTKYMFVSIADEQIANSFVSDNVKPASFRIDLSEGMRSKTQFKRYWATLKVEGNLSEKAYLEKMSGIRSADKDIITAPYFKGGDLGEIG